MLFGTISGGITAELTGEDGALRKCLVDIFSERASMCRERQGAATGLAVSALNHVAHRVSGPLSRLQGDPEPWDLNGEGILQKVEADLWGVKEGTDITVDNSKIDWTGLEIPEGYNDLDIFSLETHEAFLKLPWETAATYGGTSFKVISVEKGIVEVQDQSYHYNMRPNNSVKNILRNIATKIGYPTTMELYNGRFQPYMIPVNQIKVNMKKTIIIFLLIILYACKFDKSEYFFFDKYDSMDVGDGKETFIYKSKKKWNYDTIIVHSDIEKFGENSTYIIALQNPNKELMLKRIISSLEVLYKYNSENDSVVVSFPHTYTNVEINKRYKKELDSLVKMTQDSSKAYRAEAENIFQDEAFYQRIYKNPLNYYIIDKKEDSVFGPLTKKEYRNIKEKRGIKLEFKN